MPSPNMCCLTFVFVGSRRRLREDEPALDRGDLKASFFLLRAFAPRMADSGGGAVAGARDGSSSASRRARRRKRYLRSFAA